MKKWECTICGYIHEGETPPDECPICGAGPEYFEVVVDSGEESQPDAQTEVQTETQTVPAPETEPEAIAKPEPEPQPEAAPEPAVEPALVQAAGPVKKWECTVCGYIHEGETPPNECPVCGVGPAFFKEVVEKEEKTLTQAVLKPESAETGKQSEPGFFRKMVMKHHLHPIAVHTPNGVLPLALVFLAIATIFGVSSFEQAAFYSLVFTLINMPFVIVTGYIVWQDRYKGAKTKIFGLKIGGAIIVLATLLALVIWRLVEPGVAASPGRWTYLLICLVCVAGAGISGHFGGKLVFGSRNQ
jgi:rubrerythrin/uncharacterized membrane protein